MTPINIEPARAIKGWMSREELGWLGARAAEASVVVEVGAWLGRATRVLGDHCPGVVYAIDPWDGYTNDDNSLAEWMLKGRTWDEAYAEFLRNVGDLVEAGRVVPIRKPSMPGGLASLRYRLKGQLADMVFLDGDHRYDALRAELPAYRRLVKPGGILAGHDYGRADWPGVQRAVDELIPSADLHIHRTIWSVRV